MSTSDDRFQFLGAKTSLFALSATESGQVKPSGGFGKSPMFASVDKDKRLVWRSKAKTVLPTASACAATQKHWSGSRPLTPHFCPPTMIYLYDTSLALQHWVTAIFLAMSCANRRACCSEAPDALCDRDRDTLQGTFGIRKKERIRNSVLANEARER